MRADLHNSSTIASAFSWRHWYIGRVCCVSLSTNEFSKYSACLTAARVHRRYLDALTSMFGIDASWRSYHSISIAEVASTNLHRPQQLTCTKFFMQLEIWIKMRVRTTWRVFVLMNTTTQANVIFECPILSSGLFALLMITFFSCMHPIANIPCLPSLGLLSLEGNLRWGIWSISLCDRRRTNTLVYLLQASITHTHTHTSY